MIKKILIFCLSIFMYAYSNDNTWITFYDMFSNSWPCAIQETYDHGYIITGNTDTDIFLIRTDNSGIVIWYHTYGGNSTDNVKSIVNANNNNYIIVGNSSSFSDNTNMYTWIIKVDDSGKQLWSKIYGNNNFDFGSSIDKTTDGNYIISFTQNAYSSDSMIGLMKLNQEGNNIWTKLLDNGESIDAIPVSDNEYAILYSKNDVALMGSILSLIITDNNGILKFKKDYSNFGTVQGNSILHTVDDGFLICGQTNSEDFILIKTDKNGVIQWSNTYEGRVDGGIKSIKQTNDNGYIVTGFTYMNILDIFVLKLNESGQIQWEKYFIGQNEDTAGSMILTSDSGYLISGCSNSFNINFNYRSLLIKTDSIGSNLSMRINNVNRYTMDLYTSNFKIYQNYPNPFNNSTNIHYSITVACDVKIYVYDILGQKIDSIVDNFQEPNDYNIRYSNPNLSTGIYLIKTMINNKNSNTLKITLMK